MKKAILTGCGTNADDPGRILIHRYVESHVNDDFDVMDADASMSPYEMTRRINGSECLLVVTPAGFGGVPFALQLFIRNSVYMLKKGLPTVFFVYTELEDEKVCEPALKQLSLWSERAGIEERGKFTITRIGVLEKHPEATMKAGWLHPLGDCFARADEALKGNVQDGNAELWAPAGMYRRDLFNTYAARAAKNKVSKEDIKGEARYVHYL